MLFSIWFDTINLEQFVVHQGSRCTSAVWIESCKQIMQTPLKYHCGIVSRYLLFAKVHVYVFTVTGAALSYDF